MRIIITMLTICFFALTPLYADTIIMKDRQKIKGLVVEKFVDRITLSTVDGEKSILRKDIDRIEYDIPEHNFMYLGKAYEDKGWYDKAESYYKKAIVLNPDYKEAREAYVAVNRKIERQKDWTVEKEIEQRNIVTDWRRDRNREKIQPAKDKVAQLKKILGISLVEKDGDFTIDEVRPYSSAAKSGIQKGDILVAIWGRLIRYSKMEDIVDELIGPEYSEARILVEKEISIPIEGNVEDLYKELGILLSFQYQGLVVEDIVFGAKGKSGGLKKGDFVVAIDKNITRYLPLDSVIALINNPKNNKNIIFDIRRTINLRREGG